MSLEDNIAKNKFQKLIKNPFIFFTSDEKPCIAFVDKMVTDGPTDRRTDRWTDMPSHRDVIDKYKNGNINNLPKRIPFYQFEITLRMELSFLRKSAVTIPIAALFTIMDITWKSKASYKECTLSL